MTLPENWVAKVSIENVRKTNNIITVKDIILKRTVCLYQTLGIQTLEMLITELENNNQTTTLFDVKTCLRFPTFFTSNVTSSSLFDLLFTNSPTTFRCADYFFNHH